MERKKQIGSGERRLRKLGFLVAAALTLLVFTGSCAHTEKNREWKPGDTITCPHCGRPFTLPHKGP